MGTLYVVATPIGNLEDITLRALRVLGEAELLFAEDTRRTRILLTHHALEARPESLHAHNEQSRIQRALDVLGRGASVAFVSDAGTPLISDPGERLVAAAIAAGHRVEALPGASAVLAALAISGLPAQPFTFLGFLPRRTGARRALLEAQRDRPETLVVFESPRRIGETLHELAEVLGERRACVARELTKRYEEAQRGTLSELSERFADGARGEVTIVVGPQAPGAEAVDPAELDDRIRALLAAGERPKQIAAALADATALSKRDLYARALRVREAPSEAGDE